MKNDLNRSRIFVTYLQQNYDGRHTLNSAYSTTKAEYYKQKRFLDSENLHATIKYSGQWIFCTPVKPNNIINIKCALVFCDKCLEYIIPDE